MDNKEYNLKQNEDNKYDIEVINLCKDYRLKKKKISALKNINLNVKKGEIMGLLGPNGAGKTTLISILSTLIQPTSGTAKILGYDIIKQPYMVKINIGTMFGAEMIYHRLTGFRNLKYYSQLYGITNYKKRIKELAEMFNLTEWLDQYVDKYSRGMKLKLALARILLIKPKILFLDEPLLGLDPKSVKELIEILKNLKQTIIVTSHQMNIIEKLCDRIAFLKKGQIIKIDTQKNFKKFLIEEKRYKIEISRKKFKLINNLKKLNFIYNLTYQKDNIFFNLKKNTYLSDIFNILKDYPIKSFNELLPNLDNLFIKLS
ncbi:MAG: ABC transporter ATP-binding protein [Candidatus Helarchaeota archaeon]